MIQLLKRAIAHEKTKRQMEAKGMAYIEEAKARQRIVDLMARRSITERVIAQPPGRLVQCPHCGERFYS